MNIEIEANIRNNIVWAKLPANIKQVRLSLLHYFLTNLFNFSLYIAFWQHTKRIRKRSC